MLPSTSPASLAFSLATLFHALALNVGTGLRSRGVDMSNMNVILSIVGLENLFLFDKRRHNLLNAVAATQE